MTAADNADELQTISSAKRTADAAASQPDPVGGHRFTITANGNGALTAFPANHGAGRGKAPTTCQLTPRNAVSGAIHWASTYTATQVTVNFAVAPVTGTGNVLFDGVVYFD